MSNESSPLPRTAAADLKDRVALVTGGSRGIGRAIAIALGRAGCRVVVGYQSDAQAAQTTGEAIEACGAQARIVRADLGTTDGPATLQRLARECFGAIEILVNNAGIAHVATMEEVNATDWDRTLEVNLRSTFLLTQAVLPDMIAAGWGRVLMLSSIAASTGGRVGPHYAASKAGMEALAAYCAKRYLSAGITVNSIAPAAIDTDMLRALGADPRLVPVRRLGDPEEVAAIALTLINSPFVTGQVIHINGGMYP